MEQATILLYDGSFNGFLTAIFKTYSDKIATVDIQRADKGQHGLFSDAVHVVTDTALAQRVWHGIRKKSGQAIKEIYFAFLSEQEGIERLLLSYIRRIFSEVRAVRSDLGNEMVLRIEQLARKVGREKHRMEAFVRFQLTADGIYFANIEPDFNVLPLISRHFRSRYADQEWIIYDLKRNYGLHYDGSCVSLINMDLPKSYTNTMQLGDEFHESEASYQELWGTYFQKTNIRSRINKKLHEQHVPRRYWKYLSEKKPLQALPGA
ncbi:TIGR03915 family putative DNA repair protein [Zeaxanthinibacter enoshimensis]|uniref:TIGR03915 family putative DNA repair protein n=1 Tax=Zeaxanthinibacter enoshimensis TaxID=392009 RepID=UPI0035658EA0